MAPVFLGGLLVLATLAVGVAATTASSASLTAGLSLNNHLAGCPARCGEVEIPYPFGIGGSFSATGASCSLPGFEIGCAGAGPAASPVLWNTTIEVLGLSTTPRAEARVMLPVAYQCYNTSPSSGEALAGNSSLGTVETMNPAGVYRISDASNELVVLGCNTLVYTNSGTSRESRWYKYAYYTGCVAFCDGARSARDGACAGVGCCRVDIPPGLTNNTMAFVSNGDWAQSHAGMWFSPCDYAFLVEKGHYRFRAADLATMPLNQTMPMRLDWAIRHRSAGGGGAAMFLSCADAPSRPGYACVSAHSVCVNSSNGPGYVCNCSRGYQGNPYVLHGCTNIDECSLSREDFPCNGRCIDTEGSYDCKCRPGYQSNGDPKENPCNPKFPLAARISLGTCISFIILVIIIFSLRVIFERRRLMDIKQQYFQQHGGLILFEKMKSDQGLAFNVFTEGELEQATNKFDKNLILGHGGQGTVYKGILKDEIPVAIKRCGLIDDRHKKEFGKEIMILSQINHRNIVRLLGCCLEVEVPVLVYEFIPNGTLFQLIHGKNRALHIPFSSLLRIANEAAEGLAFLHSYANPPILHGDVKTSNILLDENYMAKVSDFGASILAPTDESQFVTMVQGTCGYLDPEYMQTCRLTDKSDVYSFGVILLEILTGKKPFNLDGPEEERSLSSTFLLAMKENNLDAMLDNKIKGHESIELLTGLAELASQCLDMCSDRRPTMKEVSEEISRLRKLSKHPWIQYDTEAEGFLTGPSTSVLEIDESTEYIDKIETVAINPCSSYITR